MAKFDRPSPISRRKRKINVGLALTSFGRMFKVKKHSSKDKED